MIPPISIALSPPAPAGSTGPTGDACDSRGATDSGFLQGLLTNDVQAVQEGEGTYAAYLTPQGRMLTDLRLHAASEFLLAQVPGGLAAALADRFDELVFAEDVRVRDVSSTVGQLSVLGPDAASRLAEALHLEQQAAARLSALSPLGHLAVGRSILIARSDELNLPSFDVFLDPAERESFVSRLEELGVIPVSATLFEALRIDAGRPTYGSDLTAETIPLEAGLLERAISTTKGCYVGQEIIVRMLHRGGGRVARRLSKLRFDVAGAQPAAGTSLLHEGREVGRVTSVAVRPADGRMIGLGYVHRDHAVLGARLTAAAAADACVAEIVGFAG